MPKQGQTDNEGEFVSSQNLEAIKPCIKQQVICQKSSIVEESSLKLLKTTFLAENRECDEERQEDNKSEVSLEEDMLFEHKQALDELFCRGTLFLSRLIKLDGSKQNKSFKVGIFKQITLEHFLRLQMSRLRALRPALVRQFDSYLRQQRTFYRFLQHIYYSYPWHIVVEVFRYLFYTWEQYYPLLRKRLTFTQISEAVQYISGKIVKRQQDSKWHSQYLDEEGKSERRRFISVLVCSIVLVMEKCFSNPYYIPHNKIRTLNDQESDQMRECEDIPEKKIKPNEGIQDL